MKRLNYASGDFLTKTLNFIWATGRPRGCRVSGGPFSLHRLCASLAPSNSEVPPWIWLPLPPFISSCSPSFGFLPYPLPAPPHPHPSPHPAKSLFPLAGEKSVIRNQFGVREWGRERPPPLKMHRHGERTHFVQRGPRATREFLDCLRLSCVMSITPCEHHLLRIMLAVARLPAVRRNT